VTAAHGEPGPARLARARVSAARDRVVDQWRYLRMWRARGRIGSKWWVPRVGDRVRFHGKGQWLVYGVSIRRGEVRLGRPGTVLMEFCEPLTPAELDELYASPANIHYGSYGRIDVTPPLPIIQPVHPAEPAAGPDGPPTKPIDLTDFDVFTVDGEVLDGPAGTES
jgi:hypothetical protein